MKPGRCAGLCVARRTASAINRPGHPRLAERPAVAGRARWSRGGALKRLRQMARLTKAYGAP